MNARDVAATAGPAIDVDRLNKHFGDHHVVKDVSLRVQRGEIFGFLGPNGSGKTTCIRMLCGLLTPDSGTGTCLGADIVKESARIKRQVGYMTQRFSYWEDLTIRENLDFVGRLYQMRNSAEAGPYVTVERLMMRNTGTTMSSATPADSTGLSMTRLLDASRERDPRFGPAEACPGRPLGAPDRSSAFLNSSWRRDPFSNRRSRRAPDRHRPRRCGNARVRRAFDRSRGCGH